MMMKNQKWIGMAAVCFLLAGCIQSASEKDEEGDTAADTEAVDGSGTEAATTIDPTTGNVNLSTPVAGLNPAHGAPGHDCAIPVGAPLNGGAAQNQGGAQLPSSAQPAAQPAAGASAGQPITLSNGMVAQPMNGPPPGMGGDQPAQPAQTAPAGLPAGATPFRPADGLNPAHGEPGHDCGVEVGAPLPAN